MWTLQEEFSRIEIGRSTQFRNLTLFALVRRNITPAELDYLLLEDGIAHEKARITEVNGGEAVSELHLENSAGRSVENSSFKSPVMSPNVRNVSPRQ